MGVSWKNEKEESNVCYYGGVGDNIWVVLC